MSKPICCVCDTRIVGESEDVGEFMPVGRGSLACAQPCADECISEAHESVYDDDADGNGPCRCSHCMRVRGRADRLRNEAAARVNGGLSVGGLRLLGWGGQ